MRRYEVSDEEWALIADLLPANGRRGGQWRAHRPLLNGIFWRLHTGAPWRDVPARYGRWQTVYDRFGRWRREGLIDRVLRRLRLRLDAQGRIDWDTWCVDGTSVRASRAAAGGGKRGARRSRLTTRSAARGGASAPSSTW
jgi:transposase